MSNYTDFYPNPAEAATLAEAAAGTLNTKYNSPETSVPKDAAGMTGAALMPTGTTAQQPGTPVTGMLRFNTTRPDGGYFEVWNGSEWRYLDFVYDPPAAANVTYAANTTVSGVILCRNLTVNAGVTLTVSKMGVVFICTGNATINGTINADGAVPANDPQFNGAFGFINAAGGYNLGSTGSSYNFVYSQLGSVALFGRTDNLAGGGSTTSAKAGNGGGNITIRAAGNIVMGGGAQLLARGTSATAGSSTVTAHLGGAGGGSGGSVILHSDNKITTAGVINVSGGAGSAGLSLNGATGLNGGGGGGGGGWICLQASGTLTDGATKTLNGGAGGATGGVAGGGLKGTDGAGFAGNGGSPGSGGVPATAGGAGVIVYSGSPF